MPILSSSKAVHPQPRRSIDRGDAGRPACLCPIGQRWVRTGRANLPSLLQIGEERTSRPTGNRLSHMRIEPGPDRAAQQRYGDLTGARRFMQQVKEALSMERFNG